MKNNKNNKVKILTNAIPFAAALSLASVMSISAEAEEVDTLTPVLQVENTRGENIEYVEEYMNNEAYRNSARQAIKDSLLSGRPVLIAENEEWIQLGDITEGMSYVAGDAAASEGFKKSEALSDVNTYSVNKDGVIVDEDGDDISDPLYNS